MVYVISQRPQVCGLTFAINVSIQTCRFVSCRPTPDSVKECNWFYCFSFSHVWYGYPVFFPIRTKCRLFLKETRKPLLANHVILFPTHLAKMVHRLTRGDIGLFIVTFHLVAILNEDIQEFICIAKFQIQLYTCNFIAEKMSSSVLDDISTMPCI